MEFVDILQFILFLAAYAAVKAFQKWLKQRFVQEPAADATPDSDAAPAEPSLLGRAWNKIVEWDAALVEYLARDPPAAQKQQKKKDT
jgi:hypothetical protein